MLQILTGMNYQSYLERIEDLNTRLERFVETSKDLVYDPKEHKEIATEQKDLLKYINKDRTLSETQKKELTGLLNELFEVSIVDIKQGF